MLNLALILKLCTLSILAMTGSILGMQLIQQDWTTILFQDLEEKMITLSNERKQIILNANLKTDKKSRASDTRHATKPSEPNIEITLPCYADFLELYPNSKNTELSDSRPGNYWYAKILKSEITLHIKKFKEAIQPLYEAEINARTEIESNSQAITTLLQKIEYTQRHTQQQSALLTQQETVFNALTKEESRAATLLTTAWKTWQTILKKHHTKQREIAQQAQVVQRQQKEQKQCNAKLAQKKAQEDEDAKILASLPDIRHSQATMASSFENDLTLFEQHLTDYQSLGQQESIDQLIKLLQKNPAFSTIAKVGTHATTQEEYKGPTSILQIFATKEFPPCLLDTCIFALKKYVRLKKSSIEKKESDLFNRINTQSTEGLTALDYAAATNNKEKTKALLAAEACPTARCLAYAILNDAPDSLAIMLDAIKQYLSTNKSIHYPRVFASIFQNNAKIIDHLTPEILDSLVKLYPDQEAALRLYIAPSLIHRIANKEHPESTIISESDTIKILTQCLEQNRAIINQPMNINNNQTTILEYAIEANANNTVLELLLKHGANPIQKYAFEPDNLDRENNALHLIASRLQVTQLDFLLTQNPEWVTTKGTNNRTLLHTMLQKRGVDPVTNRWSEELHIATLDIILKHLDTINGPNSNDTLCFLNEQTDLKETALHSAAMSGNTGALKRLLLLKTDPTLTNNKGFTPLHIAIINKKKLQLSLTKITSANEIEKELTMQLVRNQILSYNVIIDLFITHLCSSNYNDKLTTNETIAAHLKLFGLKDEDIKTVLESITTQDIDLETTLRKLLIVTQ